MITIETLSEIIDELTKRVEKLESALLDHKQQTEFQLTKDTKLARALSTGKKKQ